MLAVPVRNGRVLVHVLDDLPPSHACVVRAERDLPHLRRVGNDAHLGAPEIIRPEILKPHPGDEHHQPFVGLAIVGILETDTAKLAAALLVVLLDEIEQTEPLWGPRGGVVAQEAQRRLNLGQYRPARRVADDARILHEPVDVDEGRHRRPLLGPLADHEGRAHTAIRMAATFQRC